MTQLQRALVSSSAYWGGDAFGKILENACGMLAQCLHSQAGQMPASRKSSNSECPFWGNVVFGALAYSQDGVPAEAAIHTGHKGTVGSVLQMTLLLRSKH